MVCHICEANEHEQILIKLPIECLIDDREVSYSDFHENSYICLKCIPDAINEDDWEDENHS